MSGKSATLTIWQDGRAGKAPVTDALRGAVKVPPDFEERTVRAEELQKEAWRPRPRSSPLTRSTHFMVQMRHKLVLRHEGIITVKPLPDRGELARQLMGAGRHLRKPGAAPIADLILEREQVDQLDQADHRQ